MKGEDRNIQEQNPEKQNGRERKCGEPHTQRREAQTGKELMKLALSLCAALLVYDMGKQAGRWLFSIVAGHIPHGPAAAGTQGLWYGFGSMAMQLTGGGICALLWQKQLRQGLPSLSRGEEPAQRESGEKAAENGGPAGPGTGEKIGRAAAFLCLAATSALGLNLLLSLTGFTGLSSDFGETAAAQASVPFLPGVLLYGLAAPFSEEILFRGILYGKARSAQGPGPAMVFSGLLFGIYHGNLVQGLYAFLLGVLLAFVYERTGKLRAAMLFHGTGNLAVFWLIDGPGPGLPAMALWQQGILCVVLLSAAVGCLHVCFGGRSGDGK